MYRSSSMFAVVLSALALLPNAATADHFDIAPYFQSGKLLTGGLDHLGTHAAPPITVYGYDFGEDPADPFNPTDPGVNQAAGVGNLPAGAPLRYNILSSLRYWDGSGAEPAWTAPPGQTHLDLWMGTTSRTLTGSSGAQSGALIQSVATGGVVHKHFTSSLFADNTSSNVPTDLGFVAPADGVYAFSLELTLTHESTTYTSDPLWVVFNNGLSETAHDAAIESLVPEPAGLGLLTMGSLMLLRRRGGPRVA